jgi:DNA-binding NarL/FixJ family response regulator
VAIDVAIVDDHAIVRQSIAAMLDGQDGLRVVGQAGSLEEGHKLAEKLLAGVQSEPLVFIVDVTMPDGSGLSLVRTIRRTSAQAGVVVLTMHNDDSTLLEALDTGASALVRKSDPVEEVVSAVKRAAESPSAFSATGLAEAMRRQSTAPQATLTARETEVLRLLVDGASVSQVSKQLYMSPSTVKTHITKIYDKLGAHNRASAVIAAVRLGLVPDS